MTGITLPPCQYRSPADEPTKVRCKSCKVFSATGVIPAVVCMTCQWIETPCDGEPIRMGLIGPGWGDRLSNWLDRFGLTKQRFRRLTGKPCGCSQRQEKLNRVGWRIADKWRAMGAKLAAWLTG